MTRSGPMASVWPVQLSSTKPVAVPTSTSRFARSRAVDTGAPLWWSASAAREALVTRWSGPSSKWETAPSGRSWTGRPTWSERAREAWYFADVRNRVSIQLHERAGFETVTDDFWFPTVTDGGGSHLLGRVTLPPR
jgi:hypothetical protein